MRHHPEYPRVTRSKQFRQVSLAAAYGTEQKGWHCQHVAFGSLLSKPVVTHLEVELDDGTRKKKM